MDVLTINKLFEKTIPNLDNLTFIQIGTNSGDDFFNKVCKTYNPKKILLIEPHTSLNNSIHINYNNLKYEILNIAVSVDEDCASVNMYSPTEHTGHSSIKPLKDWNTDVVFATVPCKTLKKILKEYNLNHINLLYIDTEGYDAFIIDYIFKNNLQTFFDIIVYEQWGFGPECYTEQNSLNGQEGMNYIKTIALENNFLHAFFQAGDEQYNSNHVIYKKHL